MFLSLVLRESVELHVRTHPETRWEREISDPGFFAREKTSRKVRVVYHEIRLTSQSLNLNWYSVTLCGFGICVALQERNLQGWPS